MQATTARPAAATNLSERDQQILMFERQWWRFEGSKEQAITSLFGLEVGTYYQVLAAIVDTEEALAFDPHLTKRLRRMRETRQRARSARRLGPPSSG
ncbi:MAG: DUF3263 domain-containing protein [Micrococcales bacterium]|nr:DUF3263 domain-containing protein [Micrococcales bacterium]